MHNTTGLVLAVQEKGYVQVILALCLNIPPIHLWIVPFKLQEVIVSCPAHLGLIFELQDQQCSSSGRAHYLVYVSPSSAQDLFLAMHLWITSGRVQVIKPMLAVCKACALTCCAITLVLFLHILLCFGATSRCTGLLLLVLSSQCEGSKPGLWHAKHGHRSLGSSTLSYF